jgi:hypothetical protein
MATQIISPEACAVNDGFLGLDGFFTQSDAEFQLDAVTSVHELMAHKMNDLPECDHELDLMLGLGVGLFERCSKCRAEFVRVKDGPQPGDWHYERSDEA